MQNYHHEGRILVSGFQRVVSGREWGKTASWLRDFAFGGMEKLNLGTGGGHTTLGVYQMPLKYLL